MEGIPVLVCLQVREDTIDSVIPGATQGECDKCSHRVWISLSGQKMMAEQEVRVRCLECISKEPPGPNVPIQIVKGAVKEILSYARDLRGSSDGPL